MLNKILNHYQKKFAFDRFYDQLVYNIQTWPQYHISNNYFLQGYSFRKECEYSVEKITTKCGDLRIDLPVWFGSADSKLRIALIGLEPRDTDKTGFLNIERVDNKIFATPFALERLTHGKYYTAFNEFVTSEIGFIYFTDVVKEYAITGNKAQDDLIARESFYERGERDKDFLLKELSILCPNKIFAIGNDTYHFLNKVLEGKYSLSKLRHPSYGGSKKAKEQLFHFINETKGEGMSSMSL